MGTELTGDKVKSLRGHSVARPGVVVTVRERMVGSGEATTARG